MQRQRTQANKLNPRSDDITQTSACLRCSSCGPAYYFMSAAQVSKTPPQAVVLTIVSSKHPKIEQRGCFGHGRRHTADETASEI